MAPDRLIAGPPDRRRTVLIAGGGTGGHLMPALAIAEALRAKRPDIEPVLVGATRGIETQILPTRDFRHHFLSIEPFYRQQWWKNVRLPYVAWRVHRELKRIFAAERPALVVGTGGYASLPAVWYGAGLGLPSAIQEQNAWPGLATKRLAARVDHVYLGLPEAKERLRFGKQTKVWDTGNPIVPPDPARREVALKRFGLDGTKPVVLVTGGSQGAVTINRAVAGWIEAGGAAGCSVIWATGRGSYAEFAKYQRTPDVQVFGFLDPMADAFAVADLAVARAGMMTGAELCAWGIPSILVPLPTAASDHQTGNAVALEVAGAAVHLPQRDLSTLTLGRIIAELLTDDGRRRTMATRAKGRGRPHAVDSIVSHLLTLLGSQA
ncbi:MAG: UDP-N-acetylglucosamine--N-acetylmuramyl-(pentapeptide) pyrophosphoryl-undecaprenol N-acetylglucosamine transferase, partial [Gemmatimonadetes bacterium]|nr:UDP-N-acetylglucosamine--N-acetylmuramyl-(pentapeptide) pyrophosphoryl-undecaprenol N-acetylglucosamine transferase [Gemmatimonadota bacterium]